MKNERMPPGTTQEAINNGRTVDREMDITGEIWVQDMGK